MTIQDWGSIGELIAAIATILTLVYLSYQIRANTISAQTASRVSITNEYRNGLNELVNAEIWSAWANGLHNYPNIPFEQRGAWKN